MFDLPSLPEFEGVLPNYVWLKSRFFILKSVGKSVIYNSFFDGTYSVQKTVAVRLNRAFSKTDGKVILFFSVKKSRAFQAVGSLESNAIECFGGRYRFRIHWITGFINVPFKDVVSVKQRIGSTFSVTNAQDGQEIGRNAGKHLLSTMLQESARSQEKLNDSYDSEGEELSSPSQQLSEEDDDDENSTPSSPSNPSTPSGPLSPSSSCPSIDIEKEGPLVWNLLDYSSVDVHQLLWNGILDIVNVNEKKSTEHRLNIFEIYN